MLDIKGEHMTESNILAGNVENNFQPMWTLLDIKEQCMKDLDTLADDAAIKPQQREVWQVT